MTTETPAAGMTSLPAAGSNLRSVAWMDSALCAQTDPDLWFSETGHTATAQQICGRCPVRTACRTHVEALEAPTFGRRYGTWAGVPGATRTAAAEPGAAKAARNARILHLASLGRDAAAIADSVGCDERTVYRVIAAAEEAAT
ncbi:WhiB family transcriptional regulator [Streptomyces roseus]|uniref:WhiB family transcriptional regulator n=1 Tax=Streptomyces roseus TaxID=66430 RepID=UPI0037F135B0